MLKRINQYIQDKDLDPTDKIIMIYYTTMAKGTNQCQVSVGQLSEGINSSPATVSRKCKKLKEKGYIEAIVDFGKVRGRSANIIRILK